MFIHLAHTCLSFSLLLPLWLLLLSSLYYLFKINNSHFLIGSDWLQSPAYSSQPPGAVKIWKMQALYHRLDDI